MSDNYVPNFEDRYYEVHPSQLRWAMSQLGAIPGYNVQGYAQGRGGMYIIVVQVPIGAEQQDWRAAAPPRRRLRWDFDVRVVVKWLCVLVIVGGLGYLGYTMATGGTLPTLTATTTQTPRGESVVEESGWHWPWESSVVSKPQPKPEPQGFRWPWEDAQANINQGFEQLTNGLMIVGVLFLLALILWGIGLVRGALGK